MYSSRVVMEVGTAATAAAGSVNSCSSITASVPARSTCDSGYTVRRDSRPVSAWAAGGRESWRVDPVRTNRPGRLSWFSSALMASRMIGAFWHSSTQTGSGPDTKAVGSAATALRVAGSSRSRSVAPMVRAISRSRVDFPTERGPSRRTTGSSRIRSVASSRTWRGTMPPGGADMTGTYHKSDIPSLLNPTFRGA